MGDRAYVHITIGGTLLFEHFPALAAHAADYDLRTEWEDGEPLDLPALVAGKPLELYGTELNGGQIPTIDAFCVEHGLPFRRWSGGCLGAFLPEFVLFEGAGPLREYMASEDETVLFPPSWIRGCRSLRDLKRAVARAEFVIPPFVLLGDSSDDRD